MNKTKLIYNIYLYTFTTIGLIITIIGLVKIIDLTLKTTIFKNAELDYYSIYPEINENSNLTEEEKNQIITQREKERKIQALNLKAQKERTLANSLALILVGFPIFIYHFKAIKREIHLSQDSEKNN